MLETYIKDHAEKVKQLQESSLWVAATRSVPTVLVFGAFGVWLLVSPSDILGRRPRLVLCGQFSEMWNR